LTLASYYQRTKNSLLPYTTSNQNDSKKNWKTNKLLIAFLIYGTGKYAPAEHR